ncbi:MAG: transcription-repair coupling factor (superfamily II helicase) [Hyphomicrobiaceae bacterium]|jgi:transcription-repair coupling factor (superfamily II helicase)
MSGSLSTRDLGRDLVSELERYPELRWKLQGLRGGASAYLLATLSNQTERPILTVTATAAAAEMLASDVASLVGEDFQTPFLQRRVHLFAARESPPLELVSPASDTEAQRTAALYQLANGRNPVVIASIDALAQRTPSRGRLSDRVVYLVVGEDLILEDFSAQLARVGYRSVRTVEEPGEFAVRGGILDLWPPGFDVPSRIELDGDEIASLRLFQPGDQRSFETIEELVVLPSMVFDIEELAAPAVRRAVGARCDDLLLPASERRQLDEYLATGVKFPGVELFAPYTEKPGSWLVDYLGANAIVVVSDPPAVEESIARVEADLVAADVAVREAGSFFPEPVDLYASSAELSSLLERKPLIELDYAEAFESGGEPGNRVWRVDVHANTAISAARARVKARRGESGFAPVVAAIDAARQAGNRVIMLASDKTQLEHIEQLLELSSAGPLRRCETFDEALAEKSPKVIQLVRAHLHEGFTMAADHLTVVTDAELFGERRVARRVRRISRARAMASLAELDPGDHIVHVDHGVGLYKGLRHLVAAGTEGDFLHIEYAGGDRYYLPVDRINLVEKYSGASASGPVLDKLGGVAWARTKRKARDSILEMARELLDLEAHRQAAEREPLGRTGADFAEFEARFPFEETEGQLDAIRDLVADLTGRKPMDRVVCGDVGYGKTEVAIRAAYLAAMGGYQVGFLVPTTVLARQHYESLIERFDGYPLKIAMLSRFQSRQENLEIVNGLKNGTVDIVVGTHRLLQKDVQFAKLGLLVIDEEHRFGVKAKEHVKTMRRNVDVLTMTATPIPRTLQLAMTGVRDLSLIETPPVDRLAIRTYVARYDEGLIKQAIERELARGGQIFFVHNRVASIEMIARRLRDLVPDARVTVGHGQMKEGALERVMLDFLEHKVDVLVCSTIVESGLDIPNANTILINRADSFGLAQLYQIRGRVGRSHRRAYAYLLIPGEHIISEVARKRLAVLQQLDDLGAGFRLAAHDMEIRGAGNLLGKQQSGHIAAIGFDLFMRMMEEATAELRGSDDGPRVEPEVDLGAEAFIPDNYVDDVGERLQLYKRLANAFDRDEVESMADEMIDRFGPMPPQSENFIAIMALRPALRRLAVESLKASGNLVSLRFADHSRVDSGMLVELVRQAPRRYRMRPDGGFTMQRRGGEWEQMVADIGRLLDTLVEGSFSGG